MTMQRSETMHSEKTRMTSTKQIGSTFDIQTMVHLAAKSIAPVWPLKTFIACNALRGFEEQPFDTALMEAFSLFESDSVDYQVINQETIKWCATYFDEGQSVIGMPVNAGGFYATFKDLAPYDKRLTQAASSDPQWLKQLPDHAEDAVAQCLERLKIPNVEYVLFLKKSFAQLSGWSGYVKWLAEWQTTSPHLEKHANILIDFVAVRLIITVLLHPEIYFSKHAVEPVPKQQQMIIELIDHIKKQEKNYQSDVIPRLVQQAKIMQSLANKRPAAQLVFCIDVRSEPFRRQLEALGSYETLGFAGFFGLPIRLHDYNSGKVTDSCPVLLKPRYDMYDYPREGNQCVAKQHEQGKHVLKSLKEVYQQLKYNFATPFALVETFGAWCGLLMLSQSMKPMLTISTINRWIEKIMPTVRTQFLIDMTSTDSGKGISFSEQALYAEAVLRIMGLTERFGELVIFCGHGSSTQNNPYASGLDCGACGGNHGGGNANVLAAILNKASIRSVLSERGIVIPPDTQFLAAEHNTTTDDLRIFEDDMQSLQHQQCLARLQADLMQAKMKNAASRVKYFDVSDQVDPVEETTKRSQDWSEVRPEWGLARNAAFIIAPRQLTQALDLEGRCFLHSYDWEQDEPLTSLETILTAPMVVAEWINTQYLFSTIDNVRYGSGSKITQNVTGKIGVMQGNASDLMHGLPLQSVYSTDTCAFHQPQRLLTVIYAPRQHVSKIIARQEILKTLFLNAWVHLMVIDPADNQAYQFHTTGEWHLMTHDEQRRKTCM